MNTGKINAMNSASPVLCLEFNELTPSLMDRFINQGLLPNFQRLKEQSLVAVSDAEAEGEWLNPWVQWVTIHSGLPAEEHGVFHLSNAYQLKTPAIWDLMSEEGFRVWICGSMNAWYRENLNGFVLPDAWSQQVSPYPRGEFDAFYTFVQKNVQEYAASRVPVTKTDCLRFLGFLARHGLKTRTAAAVVKQLAKERTGNHRWRRASLLDAMQYDLFEWYFRKHRPDFSTLFFNSTAHYQHKFWRNMEPDAFQIRPTAAEQRAYQDAILFGYRQMDRIVGRVLRMAPHATILLLSGLGQQPYTNMEASGGKRVFRLHGKPVLTEKLGIPGEFSYEPIMADQFFLRFADRDQAVRGAEHLAAFELWNGQEAFTAEVRGTEVLAQCRCRLLPSPDAVVTDSRSGRSVPFSEVFYRVDCIKSGFHHPDGIFWLRLPSRMHHVLEEKVPLTDVAPTLLNLMGIDTPAFMPGQSLLGKPSPRDAGEAVSTPRLLAMQQP
jgi:hypothetical protein